MLTGKHVMGGAWVRDWLKVIWTEHVNGVSGEQGAGGQRGR